MKELAKKILEKIRYDEKDTILLDNSSFDICMENYFDIEDIKSEKKIAFVDGGILELFKSPSLSLFFTRIYTTIYKNNARIKNNAFEFFSIVSCKPKDDKMMFMTENIFTKNNLSLPNIEFDSLDPKLTQGGKRAYISQIGSLIRRMAELAAAKETSADFILLDGSLETQFPHEKEVLDSIENAFGLSKTTSVLTGSGKSAAAILRQAAKKEKWGYYAGKSDYADIYFAKFKEKSEYVFRFEAKTKAQEVISLLSLNSSDPIFLGYPYGMVEADRFARVSKREKEALSLQLNVAFGKDLKKILPYLNSENAHDILDNISFIY